MKRVGLKDVARRVGVSHVSVWKAFNQPERVSLALRERIRVAADELGYAGPQAAGRTLRTGRAGVVAIYNPDPIRYLFDDPAAAAFMAGAADALQKRRTALLVLPSAAKDGASVPAEGAAVDGFILYTVPRGDPVTRRILAREVPSVLVDADPAGFDAVRIGAWVGIDERAAARLAAEHVVALGHRRIGVLAFQPTPSYPAGPASLDGSAGDGGFDSAYERWAGYADVLEGVATDVVVRVAPVGSTSTACPDAHALLDVPARRRPTALLCMSDRLAFDAMRAVGTLGLDVPGDVSIVGFDDVTLAVSAGTGGLTTVRQPLFDKGVAAVEALAGEGHAATVGTTRTLPVELVVRGSTGRKPKRSRSHGSHPRR